MSDLENLRERLLSDPETRREYERMRPQFELARQVRRYREAARLSQAELAERMGKQQPAIARFENANVQPSIAFLQQLAEALDLKLVIRLEPKTAIEASPGADSIDNVHESTAPVREKATA